MTRLSSELVLSLRDGVSGPARKVRTSLADLDRSVRDQSRMTAGIGKASAMALAQAGAVLAPAALAYGAKQALTRYAAVERSINRIGVTAGATAEETRAAFGIIDKAAYDYATTQDEVTAGLDSLVSAGRSMKEAMAFLPSVVATAQASGAAITDIATTADAVGRGFDIAGDKMQGAFDILVTAGKLGKFELKDMASYLPTLVPAFEALGYKGEAGLKKIAASLQVVRDGTGSAGEAATAFQNVIQKMESEETAKRFKNFGIDLRAEMAEARKGGKDLLDVFVQLSKEAVGGDMSKLPQLFADSQMQAGMRALLNGVPQLAGYVRELGSAAGSTQKDLAKVLSDNQAKIDRMSASWDTLVKNVGAGVSTVASPAMDAINSAMESGQAYDAGVEKEQAQGGSEDEARDEFTRRYEKANGEHWQGRYYAPLVEQFKRDMARYGRDEIASPYEDLDRVISGQTTSRFPTRADAEAASAAKRERDAGNIDADTVSRGVTVPAARPEAPKPLTATEEQAEYNRGRIAGEAATRRKIADMTGREALAGIVGRADAGANADRLRSVDEVNRNQQAVRDGNLAKAAELVTLVNSLQTKLSGEQNRKDASGKSFTPMVDSRIDILNNRIADLTARIAELKGAGIRESRTKDDTIVRPPSPGSSASGREALSGIVGRFDAKPDILGPVTQEGEAAAMKAQEIGTRITDAFSVTAKPIVDASSIDSLVAKIRTAKSELTSLGALAESTAASAASASGRTSRVDFDGLHADTTHPGF